MLRVARGADTAALAGIGHKIVIPAVIAPDPGKAMGKDAAFEVLLPLWIVKRSLAASPKEKQCIKVTKHLIDLDKKIVSTPIYAAIYQWLYTAVNDDNLNI